MAVMQYLPDIADTQPDRFIKHRVSDDGLTAEVLLPGLWHTDFDHKLGDKLSLWAISKLFESIRYTALDNGFGLYNRLKQKDRSIFMAGVTYDFTAAMKAVSERKVVFKRYPLLAKLNIIHVGRSSFSFDINIHDYNTGERLLTGSMTFVYVDYNTRKPTPLPLFVEELWQSKKKINPSLTRLSTPAIPATAFTQPIRAFSSDIDMNGHVNSSIFVKWCGDAGANAAIKGHYSGFTGDIGAYPNKQIVVKYIGEGMLGDRFVVHTWQDKADNSALHFVIKRDNNVVFVAKFSYFIDAPRSRL